MARLRTPPLTTLLSLLLFAAAGGWCSSARAEPQGNAGLTIGVAAAGTEGRFWDGGEFHLGLRGDVMFGRERSSHLGVGPYLEVMTLAFDELQIGGGANLLLPVHERLPLVLSLGSFGRLGDDQLGLEPGLAGALFWGSRSFNFHEGYVMAGGLLLGFRQSLGESQETALLITAQIDVLLLATPVVMLLDLLRGPSPEAQAIPPALPPAER